MAFNKKDIIEFIQDSISENQALPSTIISDIESIVKTQVDMGDADEYIQQLADDNNEVRRLLEDVLDGRVQGETTVQVTNNANVENTNVDNTTENSKKDNKPLERTFKDALNEQMSMNKDIIGQIMTFSNETGNLSIISNMGQQITEALQEDVFQQTGENIDTDVATRIVEESMASILKSFDTLTDRQQEKTASMFDSVSSFHEGIGNAVSAVFRSGPGGMVYDALNMITMGQVGLIESMWGTVGNIASAGESLFGYVKGIGTHTEKLKGAVSEIYSGVSNQVDKVFAEEKENLIDPAVDAAKGAGNAMGYLKTDDQKSLDLAEESNDILGEMLRIQADQLELDEENALIAGREDKEEGIVPFLKDLFSKILLGLGFIIGGAIGAVLLPFQVLGKGVLKVVGLFTDLTAIGARVISSLSRIPLVGTKITGIIKYIGGLFNVLKEVGAGTAKLTGMFKWLTPLIKGFAAGFSKLAWPLQILLGAIDFVKGFMGSSEESFLGKLKDGLKAAVIGFFEMPLKLLGWVFDKLLSFVGIEGAETGKKMIDFLGFAIDMIFNPIIAVFNLISGFASNTVGKIWNSAKEFFSIFANIFGALWNLLTGDFLGLKDNLLSIWDSVKSIIGNYVSVMFDWFTFPFKYIVSVISSVWDNIKPLLSGTMFDPLIGIFESIGKWVMSVVDWVKNKMSSIPVVGNLFKDEATKAAEEKEEKVAEIEKLRTDRIVIREQIQKIQSGEDKPWFGSSENKIKKLQEEEAKLAEKESALVKETLKEVEDKKGAISAPEEKKGGFFGSVAEFATGYTKQFQHVTSDEPTRTISQPTEPKLTAGDMVSQSEQNKIDQVKQQIEQTKRVEMSVDKMNKDNKSSSERPIVVNTGGGGDQRMIEPPTDIESMSILWLNKSWGLG